MWLKDNVLDLLQDIQNVIDEPEQKDYFLGTIVLTRGEKGVLEVADGQQRLATTMILLAAIRDYLFAKGDGRHQKIQDTYLINSDWITEEVRPRLRLNVDDNDFFRKRILSLPDDASREVLPRKESHRNIATAAELAKSHVANLAALHGNEATKHLMRWVVFLTNQARVIRFIVPDQADAFVILRR